MSGHDDPMIERLLDAAANATGIPRDVMAGLTASRDIGSLDATARHARIVAERVLKRAVDAADQAGYARGLADGDRRNIAVFVNADTGVEARVALADLPLFRPGDGRWLWAGIRALHGAVPGEQGKGPTS